MSDRLRHLGIQFAGTYSITDDPGEFANNPKAAWYASGDPKKPLIWEHDDLDEPDED